MVSLLVFWAKTGVQMYSPLRGGHLVTLILLFVTLSIFLEKKWYSDNYTKSKVRIYKSYVLRIWLNSELCFGLT